MEEDLQYHFISAKDIDDYNQVIDMRYDIFFKEYALPKAIVIDDLEENAIHIVCKCNKNVLGYIRGNAIGHRFQLSQLVVIEEARRMGIGKNLILKAEKYAIDSGLKEIFLNSKVEKSNYYKKIGYSEDSEVFLSKKTGLPHIKMSRII